MLILKDISVLFFFSSMDMMCVAGQIILRLSVSRVRSVLCQFVLQPSFQMDFSPGFNDLHSHHSDQHASPMSLPPSATPRSVAPKEEAYAVNMDTSHPHHYPSVASKITTTTTNMGPPASVSSYQPNSMPPATPLSAATPFTPRGADASHLQPSLQY